MVVFEKLSSLGGGGGGGEAEHFEGEASPPPPPVDRTLLVMSICGCLFHSTDQSEVPEFQNLLISSACGPDHSRAGDT